MRITLIAAIALAWPASVSGGPGQGQSIEPIVHRLEQQPEGYQLLSELTAKVGHRLTGSSNGRKGEAFAYGKLREAGLTNTRLERFPITFWQNRRLDFRADGRSIAAAAIAYSPRRASVRGALVDAGFGGKEDVARLGAGLKGRIALVRLGRDPELSRSIPSTTRSQRIAFVLAGGATGVVFANNQPQNMLASGTGSNGVELAIPAIVVGQDDGAELARQLAARSVTVEIAMANTLSRGSARNVLASIPGSDRAGEHIVLGAHLDSWELGTGALDNGADAMAVVAVARAMARAGFRPRRTIDFILFMGEEEGELGSRFHVARNSRAGAGGGVVYMINADMIIDPRRYNLWHIDADRAFFTALAARIGEHVPEFAVEPMDRPMRGSDGQPYLEKGTPVLYMESNLTPERMACYHAACDQLALIDESTMRHTTVALALTVAALANVEDLPARRMTETETQAYLTRFDLRDR